MMQSVSLQGTYQRTELVALLTQLSQSHDRGRLMLRQEQQLATLFVAGSRIVETKHGSKTGLEALRQILQWTQGEYRFSPGMTSSSNEPSLDLSVEDLDGISGRQTPTVETQIVAPTAMPAAQPVIQPVAQSVTQPTAAAGGMQGNLAVVDLINLIQVLCSTGQSGLLRLRQEDEGRIYIAGRRVVYASFQQLRGLEALKEMATWRKDEFRFDLNAPVPAAQNVDAALSQTLAAMTETTAARTAGDAMYFYSAPLPAGLMLNDTALEVVAKAEGVSFEELVEAVQGTPETVALAVKTLLAKNVLRTESSPCTPQKLRATKPKHAPEPKGFFKPKLRLDDLSDLELAVYDQVDGGRSLWDIRVNLGVSRESVWTAYLKLCRGKFLV
jgi:Domain of unknown function (DUF4388)